MISRNKFPYIDFRLDKDSGIPLYIQMKYKLLEAVKKRYVRDQKFFTDDELIILFNVSKMTARHAIKALVDDGVLERIHGVGTFVAHDAISHRQHARRGKFDNPACDLDAIKYKVSVFETRPCPPDIASSLDVSSESAIRYLRRLVLHTNDGVVGYEDAYILQEYARKVTRVNAKNELLPIILDQFAVTKINVSYADIKADVEIKGTLNVPIGQIVSCFDLVFICDTSIKPLYMRSIFARRVKQFSFEIQMKRHAGHIGDFIKDRILDYE